MVAGAAVASLSGAFADDQGTQAHSRHLATGSADVTASQVRIGWPGAVLMGDVYTRLPKSESESVIDQRGQVTHTHTHTTRTQ